MVIGQWVPYSFDLSVKVPKRFTLKGFLIARQRNRYKISIIKAIIAP